MRIRSGQPASDAPTAIASAPVTLAALARSAGVELDDTDTPPEATFRARLPSDLMLTTPGTRDAYRPGWDEDADDEGRDDEGRDELADLADLEDEGATRLVEIDADADDSNDTQERPGIGPETPPTAIRAAPPSSSHAMAPRPLAIVTSRTYEPPPPLPPSPSPPPSLGSLPVVPSYPSSSPSAPSVMPEPPVTRRAPLSASPASPRVMPSSAPTPAPPRVMPSSAPIPAPPRVMPPPPPRPLAFTPLPVAPVPPPTEPTSSARSAGRWVAMILILAFVSGMATTFGVEMFSSPPEPLDRRSPRIAETITARRSAQGGAAGKREAAPSSLNAPAPVGPPRVRHHRRRPTPAPAATAPGAEVASAILRSEAPAPASLGATEPPPGDAP